MVQIILKAPSGTVIRELDLPSNEPIKHILSSANLNEDSLLIFKGRILDDAWLLIEEAFYGTAVPVVYVVERKRTNKIPIQSSPNSVSNASSHRPSHIAINEPAVDEPRCRICFSCENDPSDRLFKPCLCRGTVGMVHVSCLNAWRERPENPDAYFRCSNCGYQYRISRARFAQVLSSEEYAKAGAIFYMMAVVTLVAMLSLLVLPVSVTDTFFDIIEWTPPDKDYPLVRHFVFGISCLGLFGFFTHLAELINFVRDHGTMESVFGIGMALTANGRRGVRLFCACGIAVAYRLIFQESQRLVRRIFTGFGERVLEVGE